PPPAWRDITIRHLLTHTAGLRDRFEQHDTSGAWRLDYTTQQLYDSARRTPLDFAPGANWQYSDQGYFLLGMIIERTAGQPYGQVLKQRIFDPLGMSASGIIDQNKVVPHLASGYDLVENDLRPNRRVSQYGMVSDFGIISSAADLSKYDVHKLLKPA